ncbi:MAG: hypothetical protein M3N98_13865, partial [Actinomycetota bacterium]|nr:hypothetical protein [Actinomycetota bacterium]
SAQHASANPGNPAGPDVQAPGVLVDGQLAYDLAFHAVRRAQPILPLPTSTGATPGWLVATGGNNFNLPPAPASDSDGAPPVRSGVGALLETVPAICETPELSLADPSTVPTDFATLLNDVATALGLGGPPAVSVTNGDRLVRETRREFYLSKFGCRDAQWALRRAINQASELLYVESAAFARTAHPSGPAAPHEVDLVAELINRLVAEPNLRVIIATPRLGDFDPRYGGWVRRAYADRAEAVGAVKGAAPDRVVAFHPVGFPGRAAVLRTTVVIVDDVWCLTGASHWRRRGMTFDGAADVVSFDRQLEDGYSKKIRDFRRSRMAALLQVDPAAAAGASGDWLRLARPRSAFEEVADLLAQGGLGRVVPFWPGPTDTAVQPTTVDIADPDGSDGSKFITAFAGLLAEIP